MSENPRIDLLSNLALKSIFYVCVTIVLCFGINSCSVDESIIEKCRQSCQAYGSGMKSATSRECECFSQGLSSRNEWILPNN